MGLGFSGGAREERFSAVLGGLENSSPSAAAAALNMKWEGYDVYKMRG